MYGQTQIKESKIGKLYEKHHFYISKLIGYFLLAKLASKVAEMQLLFPFNPTSHRVFRATPHIGGVLDPPYFFSATTCPIAMKFSQNEYHHKLVPYAKTVSYTHLTLPTIA